MHIFACPAGRDQRFKEGGKTERRGDGGDTSFKGSPQVRDF